MKNFTQALKTLHKPSSPGSQHIVSLVLSLLYIIYVVTI